MADKKELDAEALNKFLKMLVDGLEKGTDFVAEQAPLVIQELITWKRFWFTSQSIFFLITTTFVVVLASKVLRAKEKWDDGWYVFCSLGSVPSFIGLASSVYWASMVWFAPRLYVVTYIMEMTKGR